MSVGKERHRLSSPVSRKTLLVRTNALDAVGRYTEHRRANIHRALPELRVRARLTPVIFGLSDPFDDAGWRRSQFGACGPREGKSMHLGCLSRPDGLVPPGAFDADLLEREGRFPARHALEVRDETQGRLLHAGRRGNGLLAALSDQRGEGFPRSRLRNLRNHEPWAYYKTNAMTSRMNSVRCLPYGNRVEFPEDGSS